MPDLPELQPFESTFRIREQDTIGIERPKLGKRYKVIIGYKVVEKMKRIVALRINSLFTKPSKRIM